MKNYIYLTILIFITIFASCTERDSSSLRSGSNNDLLGIWSQESDLKYIDDNNVEHESDIKFEFFANGDFTVKDSAFPDLPSLFSRPGLSGIYSLDEEKGEINFYQTKTWVDKIDTLSTGRYIWKILHWQDDVLEVSIYDDSGNEFSALTRLHKDD